MQFMVQGAWGVIPAHLNELSPASVRGTFPGLAYQLGNLLSSRNAVLQAKVAERRYGGSYPPVLAWTVLIVASLVAVVTWCGRERRGADLSDTNANTRSQISSTGLVRRSLPPLALSRSLTPAA